MNTVDASSFMLTDYIVASLILIFIISGWMRGFVRSLIGPLAVLISTFASSLYFGIHRDISDSLLFILIGTIALTVLGHLVLYVMRQNVSPENRDDIFWGSRLLGAVVTVAWKGSFLALILIFLTALPPTIFGLKETQEDIKKSLTYYVLDTKIISKVQIVKDVKEFLACLEDPRRTEAIQSTAAFKNLIQDPKMQDLLADPQVIEEINNKDIVRLVLDKKVVRLINDRDFVAKFLAFAKVMYASRNSISTPAP